MLRFDELEPVHLSHILLALALVEHPLSDAMLDKMVEAVR